MRGMIIIEIFVWAGLAWILIKDWLYHPPRTTDDTAGEPK
jgi:hypothetical protein